MDKPKLLGIRTSCVTGKSQTIELDWEVIYNDRLASRWLLIHGGPTGFESAEISKLQSKTHRTDGWCACAGTKGRWDTLHITAESLVKVLPYCITRPHPDQRTNNE